MVVVPVGVHALVHVLAQVEEAVAGLLGVGLGQSAEVVAVTPVGDGIRTATRGLVVLGARRGVEAAHEPVPVQVHLRGRDPAVVRNLCLHRVGDARLAELVVLVGEGGAVAVVVQAVADLEVVRVALGALVVAVADTRGSRYPPGVLELVLGHRQRQGPQATFFGAADVHVRVPALEGRAPARGNLAPQQLAVVGERGDRILAGVHVEDHIVERDPAGDRGQVAVVVAVQLDQGDVSVAVVVRPVQLLVRNLGGERGVVAGVHVGVGVVAVGLVRQVAGVVVVHRDGRDVRRTVVGDRVAGHAEAEPVVRVAEAVGVAVLVEVHAVDRILVLGGLVHLAVAVVVPLVAQLRRERVGRGIHVAAVAGHGGEALLGLAQEVDGVLGAETVAVGIPVVGQPALAGELGAPGGTRLAELGHVGVDVAVAVGVHLVAGGLADLEHVGADILVGVVAVVAALVVPVLVVIHLVLVQVPIAVVVHVVAGDLVDAGVDVGVGVVPVPLALVVAVPVVVHLLVVQVAVAVVVLVVAGDLDGPVVDGGVAVVAVPVALVLAVAVVVDLVAVQEAVAVVVQVVAGQLGLVRVHVVEGVVAVAGALVPAVPVVVHLVGVEDPVGVVVDVVTGQLADPGADGRVGVVRVPLALVPAVPVVVHLLGVEAAVAVVVDVVAGHLGLPGVDEGVGVVAVVGTLVVAVRVVVGLLGVLVAVAVVVDVVAGHLGGAGLDQRVAVVAVVARGHAAAG